MSFSQIEEELEHLNADELRRLALKSWAAFVKKEGGANQGGPALESALRETVHRTQGARDHSAFLNSYVAQDDGLYDDAATR